MNKMIARLFHATACATLLMSAASLAVAADPSDARKGVQTTINKVNELLQHDASARMIADAMYEGPIGLQLHSNMVPQEIHFKNLELTTFPEDKLVTVKP